MKKKHKKKEPVWAKILLAVITLVNTALALTLAVVKRQQTLKAIRKEDKVEVVLQTGAETITPEKAEE